MSDSVSRPVGPPRTFLRFCCTIANSCASCLVHESVRKIARQPNAACVFQNQSISSNCEYFSDSGNTLKQFHHQWCNPLPLDQSYVKDRLQRPPNVLPSGPFNKSFPASHRPKFIHAPEVYFQQGRSTAAGDFE